MATGFSTKFFSTLVPSNAFARVSECPALYSAVLMTTAAFVPDPLACASFSLLCMVQLQ